MEKEITMATDDKQDNTTKTTPATTPESTATTPPKTETQPAQTGDDKRFTQTELDHVLKERLGRADAKAEERILELIGLDSIDALKGVVEAKRKRDADAMSDLEKATAQIEAANLARETAEKQLQAVQAQQVADGRKVAFNEAIRESGATNASDLFVLMQTNMQDTFSGVFEDGQTTPDVGKMKVFIKEVQNKYPMYFGTAGAGSPSNASGVNPTSNHDAIKKAELEVQSA
jgi:hypothetical protein